MASGNMATAYFDGRHIHSANNLTVYIDDEKKGSYDGGRSCSIKVTPGDHIIRILVYNDASEEAYWLGPFPAHFEAGMEYDLAPGSSGNEEAPAPREESHSTSYSYDSSPSYSSTSHSYDSSPSYGSASHSYDSTPRSHDSAGRGAGRRGGCLIPLLVVAVLILGIILCFGAVSSSLTAYRPMPLEVTDPTDTPSPPEDTPEPDPAAGFIFPHSDKGLIGQWEVESLSDSELNYAINEIYARHGYIFRSAELVEYYSQCPWYTPTTPSDEFSVDCFNQYEQQNWKLLVDERSARKSAD